MKRDRLSILIVTLAVAAAFAVMPGCAEDDNGTNPPPGGGGPTFTSGNFTSGLFVFTFTTDGTFSYRCTNHQPGMDGEVVVSAAGVDSPLVQVGQGGNSVFDPPSVNVKTGSYVRWVYNGSGMAHNVTMP